MTDASAARSGAGAVADSRVAPHGHRLCACCDGVGGGWMPAAHRDGASAAGGTAAHPIHEDPMTETTTDA